MSLTLKQLARAIPLLTAAAVADEAQAAFSASCPGATGGDSYYDPCAPAEGWSDVQIDSAGTIPIDGVLVLHGAWQGAAPGPETVSLTVTTGGNPVAGAVEATMFPGFMIWRPETPWAPGTYQITGTASNADPSGCLPAELPLTGEVTVGAEPSEALSPVEVSATEMVSLVPTITLETLVCCPGASPTLLGGGCGGGSVVQFDPELCAPTEGVGFLDLSLLGTPAAEGPVSQQLVYVLKADGFSPPPSLAPMFALGGLTMPQCAAIDVIDLGTGVGVAGASKCFGDDVADQLGPQTLDPAQAITSCELQTCEVNANGDGWDTTMCTPLDPNATPTSGGGGSEGSEGSGEGTGGQDGEKGCACAADGGAGPGALALAGGLWLLARRRRRR